MNRRNKILCFVLTMVLAVTLGVGGGAILTVSDNLAKCESHIIQDELPISAEGEEVTAENAALPSFASGSSTITYSTDSLGQTIFNVPYTGAVQTLTVPAGMYKLEAWGGSGGGAAVSTFSSATGTYPGNTASSVDQGYANTYGNTTWSALGSRGGAGGYAAGTMTLSASTTFNLYVGGAGVYGTGAAAVGGWNGGAAGSTSSNGGGGGGTDIRIGGTTYYYRVLVAGGGGGADNTGNNRGPSAMGGSDDGSGGAGGGTNGERPFVEGVYSGSAATQTAGAAFGTGQAPTTSTDTGGGGGGWYGGYATNNNNGGAGGGSGYVLTSTSARPSGYAHNTSSPYNMTSTALYTGIWSGNGKIRITMLNRVPTNKSAAIGNVARTTTKAITPATLATDADGDTMTYTAAKFYTDSACTTEATEFLEYTAASTSSITVHPKKYFASRTFYTKVQDHTAVPVVVSFTMSSNTFGAIRSAAYGTNSSNGIYGTSVKTGSNYPSIESISSSAAWGANDIYNDAGTGLVTYMITKPLETNALSKWGGITSATVNVADLAQPNDKWNNAYLDSVYITTYSASGTGYTVTASGSANKWQSLTITPGVASKTGWYRVRVTIGLFENSTAVELTSSTSGRMVADIVFRIGNARPTENITSSSPPHVVLNTTTSATASLKISDIVTDPNANDLAFYPGATLDSVVKVPTKEYYAVDKFGTAVSAVSTYYNVGTADASVIDNAQSTTDTGFEQTSIYNTAMTNASEIRNTAYVSYSISGDTITFGAIRATRSQYAADRGKTGLGHFYILVHLTDTGDQRDIGLWYPIAITVNDTRSPQVSALTFELDAAAMDENGNILTDDSGNRLVAQSKVISPYFLSTYPGKGIGAVDKANYNSPNNYVDYAVASDEDEYSNSLSLDISGVWQNPFAFNDFIYLTAASDFRTAQGNAYQQKYADYCGFSEYVRAETVKLYAPTAVFARLTDAQKTVAGITVDPDDPAISSFNGIKITAVTSTGGMYVEIPFEVSDTFGHTASDLPLATGTRKILSVKVNNRESKVRETVNTQGIAERTENDGVVTVTYTIYNLESEAFVITPYDLVYDNDLRTRPVTSAGANTNPNNGTAYGTLISNLHTSRNLVYATDNPSLACTKYTNFGYDTLRFVPGSLPFNFAGDSSTENGTESTQSLLKRELAMSYTHGNGTSRADELRISPRFRNNGDNVYLLDGVTVTDKLGSTVTLNIAIHVINSDPILKPTNPVFYLTANYNSALYNSSQTGGQGEDFRYQDNATQFNTLGYNVREFTIFEIATDPDTADIPNLSVVSMPKLGYVKDGVFHEANGQLGEPDYSDYIDVDYNVPGSGQRTGRSVLKITGKNSTQALPYGLFVQIEVSDGFSGDPTDTTLLAFQVEVLNSAPVFLGESQFEVGRDTQGSEAYVWKLYPRNMSDSLTASYIAPDEATTDILTTVGVLGIDDFAPTAVRKVASDRIKYIASDYDGIQTIALHTENPTKLPIAAWNYYNTPTSTFADKDAVAVWYGNPYANGTDENLINNTVRIVWFTLDGGTYKVVDPDSLTSEQIQQYLKNDSLNWVIKITPQASFATVAGGESGLDLTINFRDSSVSGGHTRKYDLEGDGTLVADPKTYHGVRDTANEEDVVSSLSKNFRLWIAGLGMTKNLIAYTDPNNSQNNNRYAIYGENGDPYYPSDFYYTAIDLENDPDTGVDEAVYVPISYLAVPAAIVDNMAYTVDYEHSYDFLSASGAPTRAGSTEQENMLANMTLFDPATGFSWSGNEINENPYITITYTEATDAIIADSKFVNKALYYYDENWQAQLRDFSEPLREDKSGFTLQKKNVRSKGYLELTVSLSVYRYMQGDGEGLPRRDTYEDTGGEEIIESVTLYISVPNDNMELLTAIGGSGDNAANTMELSTAVLGKPFVVSGAYDAVLTLTNDAAVTGTSRKAVYYDKSDYLQAPHDGVTRTFKERAYFLGASVSGNLSAEQIAHILEKNDNGTRRYGKNVTDQMLMDYFGVSDLSNLSSAQVNPGYNNFFTVSPSMRDDVSLSFHPVARISLDLQTALARYNTYSGKSITVETATADDKYNAYNYYLTLPEAEQLKGLKVEKNADNSDVKIYYPFRVIVYDDYESTGFLDGSYTVLTVNVYIGNSDPYVNTAMVIAGSSSGSYEYRLTIAKNDSYSLRISDFFGDRNMSLVSGAFRNRADVTATGDVVALNTTDFFIVDTTHTKASENKSTLKLESASSNATDVAISFDGYYLPGILMGNGVTTDTAGGRDFSMSGRIMFNAINRTIGNVPVQFRLAFSDGNGGKVEHVTFIITVGNQAPVPITDSANQTIVKQTDITMKTGQVFTLLPTSWENYVSGISALNGEPGFGTVNVSALTDSFYSGFDFNQKKMLNEHYSLSDNRDTALEESAFNNDYRSFSNRSAKSNGYGTQYVRYDYSEMGKEAVSKQFVFNGVTGAVSSYHDGEGNQKSGNLGFLALADDDLPWGLKIINTSPFSTSGIDGKVLSFTSVNTMGGLSGDRYCMGMQFKALGSCTNVPITVTVVDGEGKSLQYVFRITVVNTAPQLKGVAYNSGNGITWNSETQMYTMTMGYGESKNISIDSLCMDADSGDVLTTVRAYNGAAFVVDGVQGVSSNGYFSVEDNLASVTVRCNGVYADTGSSTVIRFNVTDTLGTDSVTVSLRIYTRYSELKGATSTQTYSVKSVEEYTQAPTPTEIPLVSGTDAGSSVYDPDVGAGLNYSVDLYAMFDIYPAGIDEVANKTAAITTNAAKYRLLSYNPSSSTPLTYNTNADAQAKLAYIREHFDMTFSADGSCLYLTPISVTAPGVTLPLYAAATKLVSSDETSKNLSGGVNFGVKVNDSTPTAVGENVGNTGIFPSTGSGIAPSANYLTVRGEAGYSQQYAIWNKELPDLGLFTDLDATDSLTFVSANVLPSYTLSSGTTITTQDGWQANGSLPQAYSVTVNDGILTAKIVRKVINSENQSREYTLPVEITVKDSSGNTASTVIVFEIHNSHPTFTEYEGNKYSVVYDSANNEYLMELEVKVGETVNFDIGGFFHDVDLLAGGESVEIIQDVNNYYLSLHDLNYADNKNLDKVHKVMTAGDYLRPENEQTLLFEVRSTDKDNMHFSVKGISADRGASAEAILYLRDGSLETTPTVLRLRFTVANSAPIIRSDVKRELTLLGGVADIDRDGDRLFDSEITISIADYMVDPNTADNGITGSKTYMRVYTWVWGDITLADGTTVPAGTNPEPLFDVRLVTDNNPYKQKLAITPLSGKYGTQDLTVYVIDDGDNQTAGEIVELKLRITVACDPSTIALLNQELFYKRGMTIDVNTILPPQFRLGYTLTDLKQYTSYSDPEGLIKVTKNDEGVYTIFADVNRTMSPVTMIAYLSVGGEPVAPLTFEVKIMENTKPEYREDPITHAQVKAYEYGSSDLDNNGYVVISSTDWFTDPETDDITLLSATSSKSFIVSAEIDENNNLKLCFKARGTSEITVTMTDATGIEYQLDVTVSNDTLPSLSFFLAFAQDFSTRPWLYIIIIIAIILLLLLIIFIAGVRRRKQREQAEVEALLVSEMQLEEQMRKIAAAQSQQAYLPPPEGDPNLMLSAGMMPPPGPGSQLPPPAPPNGAALPPGGNKKSGDGFDDGGGF